MNEPVSPEMIRRWVTKIERLSDNPESAHVEEDHMRDAVLRAIASGLVDDPAACAKEAIKSCDIAFPRWCA